MDLIGPVPQALHERGDLEEEKTGIGANHQGDHGC
jgi:hypothetical protein